VIQPKKKKKKKKQKKKFWEELDAYLPSNVSIHMMNYKVMHCVPTAPTSQMTKQYHISQNVFPVPTV